MGSKPSIGDVAGDSGPRKPPRRPADFVRGLHGVLPSNDPAGDRTQDLRIKSPLAHRRFASATTEITRIDPSPKRRQTPETRPKPDLPSPETSPEVLLAFSYRTTPGRRAALSVPVLPSPTAGLPARSTHPASRPASRSRGSGMGSRGGASPAPWTPRRLR